MRLDRTIYENDDYELEFSTTLPSSPGLDFALAAITYDGTTLSISDLREQYLLTLLGEQVTPPPNSSDILSVLSGYEMSKFDYNQTDQGKNLVRCGWGFRATNAQNTPDPANNQISISGGLGGRWLDSTPFQNGDFDGWRCYFENGQYLIIEDSIKVGASDITITFLNYNEEFFPTTGPISIVPECRLCTDLIVVSSFIDTIAGDSALVCS